MSDELEDILSFDDEGISEEQLMKYLKGELSAEEVRRVEMAIVDSNLLSDAAEGLSNVSDAHKLNRIKREIEANLALQLHKKPEVEKRRAIGNLNWMYVFVVLLFIVLLIGFALVIFLLDKA